MLGTWQLFFFFFLFEKITIVKVENYNFSNITFNRGKIPGEFLELFSWLREKGLDALKGKKKKKKKKIPKCHRFVTLNGNPSNEIRQKY